MNDVQLLTISASLVATLFGVLIGVLSWIGNKVYSKLEQLAESVQTIKDDLHGRITSLSELVNARINQLDVRMVKLETRFNDAHSVDKD